jgi:hypothetical protein
MVVNFRNKIFMQPMKSNIMELKGFPIFLVGEGKGGLSFLSCVWCGEWTINCFIFHLESGIPSKRFFFFFGFDLFCFGEEGGSPQSKEFSSS